MIVLESLLNDLLLFPTHEDCMWVLALNSRLYWLLPHRTYTIGRSHELDFVVNDASVSRRHATIEVRPPTPDAHLHPSVRSDLIITDLDSRFGTKMDKKIVKGTVKAPQTPNSMVGVQLGRSTRLHFRWETFSVAYSTGQTGEAHETLWKHAVELLQPLDVKILPYIVQSTNVLCRTGSTTSSLYYALVKAIPVVNTQYFHALVDTAHEYSKEGTESESVVPEWSSYCPNQQWEPVKERSQCLSGCSFHINQNNSRDVALAPILTAAGADCDDGSAGSFHLMHSEEASDLPVNVEYVTDRAIFSAIVECRGLRKHDVKRFSMPKKSTILDTMAGSAAMAATSNTNKHGSTAGSMTRKPDMIASMDMENSKPSTTGKPNVLETMADTGSTAHKASNNGNLDAGKPPSANTSKSSLLDKITGTAHTEKLRLPDTMATSIKPGLQDTMASSKARKSPEIEPKKTKQSLLDIMTQSSQPFKANEKAEATAPKTATPPEAPNEDSVVKGKRTKAPRTASKQPKRHKLTAKEIQEEEEEEPVDTSLELDPTFDPATSETCIPTSRPAYSSSTTTQNDAANFKAFRNRNNRRPQCVPFGSDMVEATNNTSEPLAESMNEASNQTINVDKMDTQASTSIPTASLNIDEEFGFTFT